MKLLCFILPFSFFLQPVPSVVPVVGGFQLGKLIQIEGQVPNTAGRFEINLQCGPQFTSKDIAFHFNPRFDGSPAVVRNCLRGGIWGTEDKQHPVFPFKKGTSFEILILCDVAEWKVRNKILNFLNF